jgi:hypothetical protein
MDQAYLILPVVEGGEIHEIELIDVDEEGHGTGRMLDHDDNQVRAFVAFGAKRPRCYRVLQKWEKNPLHCLIQFGGLSSHALITLAFRWVKPTLKYYQVVCHEKPTPADTAYEMVYDVFMRPKDVVNIKRLGAVRADLLDHADLFRHGPEHEFQAFSCAMALADLLEAVRYYLSWRHENLQLKALRVVFGVEVIEANLATKAKEIRKLVTTCSDHSVEANIPYDEQYDPLDETDEFDWHIKRSPIRRKQIMNVITAIKRMRR